MFCTNCGKEVKEGGKFCTNCGKDMQVNNKMGFITNKPKIVNIRAEK